MELEPHGWDRPVRIERGLATLLVVPPRTAESGRAAVEVERVTTGESTLVEFELDVRAGGSRCYSF
jgi:hypothetical protein